MMRDWMSDQGLLTTPALALFLFLLIFAAVMAWIFRPGSKQSYDRLARMPVGGPEDQSPHQSTSGETNHG